MLRCVTSQKNDASHPHGGYLKSRIAVCLTVNSAAYTSTCSVNMFSCQLLCNISEAIFPLVQCDCVQREWAMPKQRGSPLFCSCVLACCSAARAETFVTPRPCDSRLISVAPTLIGQLQFYSLGRSRVRAHSAPMDSVFLRVYCFLSETETLSSAPWIGWNWNHCFVSFANLTNNAEQSASSENDCRPSGQQIPSCFLNRRIRYVTKIAGGWMWSRVIWYHCFAKSCCFHLQGAGGAVEKDLF